MFLQGARLHGLSKRFPAQPSMISVSFTRTNTGGVRRRRRRPRVVVASGHDAKMIRPAYLQYQNPKDNPTAEVVLCATEILNVTALL